MLDPFWQTALTKARNGSMLHPPIGEPGSARWREGDGVPATLILCDGCLPSALSEGVTLCDFPSVRFQHVRELDLSGNALIDIPDNLALALPRLKCFFLGGFPAGRPECKNRFKSLPSLSELKELEHLSVHDTELEVLPNLPDSLQTLRVDRCPINEMPAKLPPSLAVLHLEGCPLPGDLDQPHLLPKSIRELHLLQDLQMPDGSHVGDFFGTPLQELLNHHTAQGKQ